MSKKNVDKKKYICQNRIWSDGIIHYITVHNIEPSVGFKEFIYNKMMGFLEDKITSSLEMGVMCDPEILKKTKRMLKRKKINKNIQTCKNVHKKMDKMTLARVRINNEEYVKLEKNKILILDALMIFGGRFKKYVDPHNLKIKRYSEHAGFLDFDDTKLNKIIVSGQTDRVDDGDSEIFLPRDMDEMLDYEYIFHTHPPTPKPGGRAKFGILYELPSMGDIFHFIDHYNEGNVIGSIVIAPEGLYNIRRYINEEEEFKKIESKISRHFFSDDLSPNENDLYDDYRKIFKRIQRDAINNYGVDFDTNTFYSQIAQNVSYINRFNRALNKHGIHVDYYPRKKDGKYWYIDTIFLKFKNYYDSN